MYSVFKDYKAAKAMCSKQKEYSKENFSLSKMHDVFKQVFDKYIPKFPTQVELKLPKLKRIELPSLKKTTINKLELPESELLEAPQQPVKEEINELSKM